jgi:hypothetical protein
MRGAPDWKQTGDSVQGAWKAQLLIWLGGLFNIRTLVETGTCDGYTVETCAPHFDSVHSMELAESYFKYSQRRVAHLKNVRLYQGDSRVILPLILDNVPNVPTLFWLDAHPSGVGGEGPTADAGDPLPQEIKTIMESRPDALIVIDDMPDCSLHQVESAGVSLKNWQLQYRTGEVIMHKGGYNIPAFEG